MDLQGFFKSKGYDITEKLNWDKYIQLWNSWYKGKVRKFHNYYIYNGQTKVKMQKKSLQGMKKVAEDWADLLFNEKVTITLKDEKSTKQLNDLFFKLNANSIINQGIEKSMALGTGAFVVSVQNMKYDKDSNTLDVTDSNINLEFVNANKIYPLSWNNNEIIECAFVTNKTIKGKNYIYISMHLLNDNNNYIIKNYMFEYKNKSIIITTNESEDYGFISEFDTKSDIPWFAIYKPNICNNIDDESPFGLSICANCIDTLKCLDNAYDSLDNEVLLGRKRIFISEEMMDFSNGMQQMNFDPQDISIYRMPKGFNKDSMIESSDPNIRTEELKEAVEFQLNILAQKVGFGENRYQFNKNGIQTATAVISENSDMYRTIKKHEIVLENCLDKIIKALAYVSSVYGTYDIDSSIITTDFDDSIIEDKNAEHVRAMSEVAQGLRSKKSYLLQDRNMNEQQAQDELNAINSEKQSNQEMFGFPTSEEKEE